MTLGLNVTLTKVMCKDYWHFLVVERADDLKCRCDFLSVLFRQRDRCFSNDWIFKRLKYLSFLFCPSEEIKRWFDSQAADGRDDQQAEDQHLKVNVCSRLWHLLKHLMLLFLRG